MLEPANGFDDATRERMMAKPETAKEAASEEPQEKRAQRRSRAGGQRGKAGSAAETVSGTLSNVSGNRIVGPDFVLSLEGLPRTDAVTGRPPKD